MNINEKEHWNTLVDQTISETTLVLLEVVFRFGYPKDHLKYLCEIHEGI